MFANDLVTFKRMNKCYVMSGWSEELDAVETSAAELELEELS